VLVGAWTGLLSLAVIGAIALQLFAASSGLIAIFAGFCLVFGGTLLMARVSHSREPLLALGDAIGSLRRSHRDSADSEEDHLQWFLRAAKHFRYGNIRAAEEASRHIPEPLLRRGTQLVLDGFPREQVTIALQRQMAEERDHLLSPVELLRAMAGYSPTLGMLGTLLGLVQMLFNLGAGDIDSIGASMGFALLTTVYGLVFANLILKPLARKFAQANRHQIEQSVLHLQAIMLLYARQHPEYIRELMNEMRPQKIAADKPATVSFANSY